MTQDEMFPDPPKLVSGDNMITAALPLIKSFEGFRSDPYLDIVEVPTIGYGSTHYLDGSIVTLNDKPISEFAASDLMVAKIKAEFLPAVLNFCPGLQTNNQGAALLSFAYNLGVHALEGSTLRKKILAGDFDGASKEFIKWDMAGGKEVAGLKRRRIAETTLFCTPDQS